LDIKIKKKKKRNKLLYIFLMTKDKTDKTDKKPPWHSRSTLRPILVSTGPPPMICSALAATKFATSGKVPKLLPENIGA
jgi:hypothetical protein